MKKSKSAPKPLRAPIGYGSVFKLSGRRRKPWVARVTIGWTTYDKEGLSVACPCNLIFKDKAKIFLPLNKK